MLMYLDYLKNWLDFCHGLLILLILASFWLSETGQILGLAIFFRTHGRNGLKFKILIYPDCLFNCLHFGHVLLIVLILAVQPYTLTLKQVKFVVSWHFLENAYEELAEICHANVSWLPSKLIQFWSWSVEFHHFFMSALWFSANIIGLWQLRGATVIRCLDLLVHL